MADYVSGSAAKWLINGEMIGGLDIAASGQFEGLPGGNSGSVAVSQLHPSILNNNIISALNSIYDSASGNEPGAPPSAVQFNAGSGDFGGNVKFIFNASDGVFLDAPLSVTGTVTSAGRVLVDDATDATSKTDGSLQTDGGLSVAKAIYNGTAATLAADSGVVTMGSTTAATISAAGVVNVNNTTDATSKTDGSLQTDGGLSVAKAIYNGTGATLAADSGVVTMGSTTGATVSAAGVLNVNNATDATSKTDGSLQTDGGLSVAKAIYNGTAATLAADSGVVTMGSTTAATISAAGVVNVNNTTDATSKTDGSLQTDGGLSVAKAIYNGTGATLAADSGVVTMGSTTGATVSAAGVLNVSNATEATSTTDGSLQTDGGLSVAKSAVIGDDLDLLSDGAIINFGDDKDVTLTHVADTGLLLNSDSQLQFRDSTEHILSRYDGDLDLVAGNRVNISSSLGLYVSAGVSGSSGIFAQSLSAGYGGEFSVTNAGAASAASLTSGDFITDGVLTQRTGSFMTVAGGSAEFQAGVSGSLMIGNGTQSDRVLLTLAGRSGSATAAQGFSTQNALAGDWAHYQGHIWTQGYPNLASNGAQARPAFLISASADMAAFQTAGNPLAAASIPYLQMQGIDHQGTMKDYKLQISGGILTVAAV